MKNVVVVVVILVVLALAYFVVWPAIQGGFSKQTSGDRVKGWLEAQKRGDEQTALCMWAVGKPMMSSDEMQGWTDDYDAFRKSAGFLAGEVANYTVDSVDPPNVSVTINGKPYKLHVEDGTPIRFVN